LCVTQLCHIRRNTPERELIERLRSPRHSGSGIEDTLLEAADTIEALLSRVDKLKEALRVIEKLRLSGMETAAQRIARATLNRSAS